MSDARLDALAQSASNRGLKLVRSRIRTPGKGRFGKAGITDGSGKPVFGMDQKGPIATPDEVEEYLRKLEAQDWGASLDAPVIRPKKPKRKSSKIHDVQASEHPRPASRPSQEKPEPAPGPQIRTAKLADAARLAELICELGHEIDAKQVRKNLSLLGKTDETPLVATLGSEIVGMCGVGKRVVIGRPKPLGRITTLIVTKDAQGHGIGKMLVTAAETWMRKHGCQLVEVTSNDRRAQAHAFYRHLGYDRTSIRFAKAL